jgi:NAD(P)-dependent dehydrogenase (short-subunit alcohol dehydrogenase family)
VYPTFDVAGQVALVTGAARGIGRSIALTLANAGADVAVGLRNLEDDNGVVREIEALGRRAVPFQMDVTDLSQIRSAVDKATDEFGSIDILINNAGRGPGNLAEDVREEDFDLALSVNLKGTFFTSQYVGRIMIEQQRGAIVNVGSQAGFVALPGEAIYCMSKAAVSHLTKCLAVEWGKHGIRVNAVAPTFIHTRSIEKHTADAASEADIIERIAALHRIGEPVEVAGAVLFLVSSASSLITGETLMVDGGWTIRRGSYPSIRETWAVPPCIVARSRRRSPDVPRRDRGAGDLAGNRWQRRGESASRRWATAGRLARGVTCRNRVAGIRRRRQFIGHASDLESVCR